MGARVDAEGEAPGVLIVDDEAPIRHIYERWLEPYDTHSAAGGEEALGVLEDHADGIGVVLLDRNMPGMGGEEVLGAIRDRGYDCRVAMVTAVTPDYDIIEMPFDEYVTKPLDDGDLQSVVAELQDRAAYDEAVGEWYSLVAKRAALETELTSVELDRSGAFDELEARIADARERVGESMDVGEPESFRHAIREF